jgi:hypothetical protein
MRIWILPFLLITHSAIHAATVLSQGARNVKNGAEYGGASAFGDGIHDDTQAFLDALNIGMNANWNGGPIVPIYVPPGTYLISKTLILWAPGFIFGEPSNPPTLILKSGSMVAAGSHGPAPFVTTVSSYNHHPYDSDWWDAGNTSLGYASTNNTFNFDLLDINFTVQSNNAGCSDVVLWQTAQRVSFRNSIMTRNDSINNCFRMDNGGGGGIMQNLTCNGGANVAVIANTSACFFRGCTFNGLVSGNNGTGMDGAQVPGFLACTFNNPGGPGLNMNYTVLGMDDCIFTSGTSFPGNSDYHLERTTLPTGYVTQLTGGGSGVYYNRISESGSSANLNAVVSGSALPNPAFPEPTSACVNVKSYGAKGDGSTDDTAAIIQAYANNNEVYFPPGNYITSSTITLSAGQKMFGNGPAFSQISGSSNPVINTTGNASGSGVVLRHMVINGTSSTGTCMTWNADPSSIMASCQLRQSNSTTTTPPRFIIQTGGLVWDESFDPADSVGALPQQATCVQVNSSGGVYGYALDIQHYGGPTWVINNAANVWVKNIAFETTSNWGPAQANQIINSNNINWDGVLVGSGGNTVSAVFKVANSQVGLFCINSRNNTILGGLVLEAGTYYGASGSSVEILDGYRER